MSHNSRRYSPIIIQEKERKIDRDWSEDRPVFKGLTVYEVEPDAESGLEPGPITIKYSFQNKYGRRRRYITVYRQKSKPLAEFIGTDQWSTDMTVVWKLRQSDGKGLVRDLRDVPDGYEEFDTVRFREEVTGSGASACWGIKVTEDPEKLIAVGLARELAIESVVEK